MLANGITLGYKKDEVYTILRGLKEVPELGAVPEKVEVTTLDDKVKQYELGIGDAGEMIYKFKYENESAESAYRVLRNFAASGAVVSFEETLPDGTKFQFDAQCNVIMGGGTVNAAVDFTLNLALQSEIVVVDPE